ncbi:PREDICTED: proline-rich protein 23C-like [Chrysochloris asiatica]|uniref:Proline-rich protein 23C-like n=1 Tax=Chrysochloris asiatica TaxID=185453 RepID=A0A9B0U8J2_CHRAS|nr:PREDICTED: proline-rich protein 23C-like [Chrysochloris asiatica]
MASPPDARSSARSAIQVMNRRPRNPRPCVVPWWRPQPVEPRPAKDILNSMARTTNCALQVPLRDADLVPEPAPASVLRVSLGDHTLILFHEALLG